MEVKRMGREHLDQAARLEQLCFSQPWSRESLAAELERSGGLFLVAEEDGLTVGYLGMNRVLDEGYIGNVAVDPQFRRQGVGSLLVGSLADYARAQGLAFLTLEVRESNFPAIRLYEKFGFRQVGRRRRFYQNPTEDALIMTLEFTEEQGL